MVGLKSKVATFQLQRAVNNYRKEPLLAILPGVALQELWGMLNVAENAMLVISACVVFSGLFGMLTVLLSGLNERRREMAILRSVGARPAHIYCLLVMETCLLTVLGILLGTGLLFLALAAGLNFLETEFGLYLQLTWLSLHELGLLGIIFIAGLCTGLIPGYRAYRYSLADGMTIRI
ncbi:ABC transporter permease [Aliamphritea spongicola]|nr:ABC transporter permease [Aliamphritea spongicola]